MRTGADRRAFIDLPFRLYRDDPMWVPPLRRDVEDLLNLHHPFHAHASVELFLARDESGTVVGRIAAVKNDAHLAQHKDGAGFFGFFETVRHPDVPPALLDAVAQWLVARGLTTMRGPASFSVNEECGLLVRGFDSPPFVMMPHNPQWYADALEAYGLRKSKDLIAYRHQPTKPPERVVRVAEKLAARHKITIRPLDMKNFDRDVGLIRTLYNEAWEANWGAVPMSDAEFSHMAKQLKPVAVPDLVLFAEVGGKLAGFVLALPDLNLALKHMNGRLLPFGWAIALWKSRSIHQIRVLTLGVLPQFRRTGAADLLYMTLIKNAEAKGMASGESSWILEDNILMNEAIERVGGVPYKTYRFYDKAIGPAAKR